MNSDSENTKVLDTSKKNSYKKSNLIISAVYKSTAFENKVLAVALNNIEEAYEDKEGSLTVTMKAGKLKELMHTDGESIYNNLEKAARKMVSGRSVGFSDPDSGSFLYVPLITKAEYKNGEFSLRFPPEMKPMLKNMKNQYTVLNLETMLKFDSVYALRLYEVLKSKAYVPGKNANIFDNAKFKIEMSVAELKLELGVVNGELAKIKSVLTETGKEGRPDYEKAVEKAEEKMYDAYTNFRRRVLEVAVAEINLKTNMHIDWEPIRTGKGGKTTDIRFFVKFEEEKHEKEVEVKPVEEQDIDDFLDNVRETLSCKVKTAEARAISEAANYIFDDIIAADEYVQTKNYDDYVAYMIETVRNKWYKSETVIDKTKGKSKKKVIDVEPEEVKPVEGSKSMSLDAMRKAMFGDEYEE